MDRQERQADDRYESQNDQPAVSGTINDSSYSSLSKGKDEPIDIVEDQEDVGDLIEPESGFDTMDEPARDDNEDVDTGNVMRDRTRHAKPQSETKYDEGPDYEDELEV